LLCFEPFYWLPTFLHRKFKLYDRISEAIMRLLVASSLLTLFATTVNDLEFIEYAECPAISRQNFVLVIFYTRILLPPFTLVLCSWPNVLSISPT
jgi:hypothetical protein